LDFQKKILSAFFFLSFLFVSVGMSKKNLCQNCLKADADKERAPGEKLCKSCVKKLDRVFCQYCEKCYHLLERDKNLDVTQRRCSKCVEDEALFGQPNSCSNCHHRSAFGGPSCRRCNKFHIKFGAPMRCESCGLMSAFHNPKDQDKVGGRLLCYSCTVQHKIHQHQQRHPQLPLSHSSSSSSFSSHSSQDVAAVETPSKKRTRESEKKSSSKGTKDKMKEKEKEKEKKKEKAKAKSQKGQDESSSKKQRAEAPAADLEQMNEPQAWRNLVVQYEQLAQDFQDYKHHAEIQIQSYVNKIIANHKTIDDLKVAASEHEKTLQERNRTVFELKGQIESTEKLYQSKLESQRADFQTQILQLSSQVRTLKAQRPASSPPPQ